MALTKQQKTEVLAQYTEWVKQSRAIILVEYTGASMKHMDIVRTKVRESGGEFHVIKNTLARRVFTEHGYNVPEGLLENSTACGFAFADAPATAKALSDLVKDVPSLKFKGGYLGQEMLTESQIKALADLPPLPVVRGQLLGVLSAPAGKLVRTLAEPGRQVAAVLQAFADKGANPAAA